MLLFLVWRRRHLQMEISLIYVNFFYKRVAYRLFSEILLCLLFLRYNQLKIILMPETYILGWQILLSFIR